MATITFDSLKLAEKLKAQGFTAEQAEAVVRVIAEAQDDVVTKRDLEIALGPLRTDLATLKSDLNVLKWALGLNIALTLFVLGKLLALG